MFVCLIPLEVEQSWQGDFLSLARNFSWMHYAGAENRKGVEEKPNRLRVRDVSDKLHEMKLACLFVLLSRSRPRWEKKKKTESF
jgi:hypothetical protein